MNESLENTWLQYLETPRHKSEPVKLDKILAARMKMFMKKRKVKPFELDRSL